MIGNRITKKQENPSTTLGAGKKTRKQGGFTLMETLVVLAIFSILGIAIIDVFLLSLNSQRQASYRQKTLANLRYVAETIARRVRTSQIDYDDHSYTGQDQALYLKDSEGDNEFAYYLDKTTGEVKMIANNQESSLTDSNEVSITNLTFFIDPVTNPFVEEHCNDSSQPNGCLGTNDCTVEDDSGLTGFCICNPNSDVQLSCATKYCDDPALGGADDSLGLCLPFNVQPRVTIVLGFQSKGTKAEDQKQIYIQTTVSSRVYKR